MTTKNELAGFTLPKLLKEDNGIQGALNRGIVELFTNNKEIRDIWDSGLMFGFLSKGEIDGYLSGQKEGTFLIRFSGTQVGAIALSFLTQTHIRHFCFSQPDLDFLGLSQRVRNVPFLTHVYCPRPVNGQVVRFKLDAFPGSILVDH